MSPIRPLHWLLLTLVVFGGTLAALAVAGLYARGAVKDELQAAQTTPLGRLAGLLGGR